MNCSPVDSSHPEIRCIVLTGGPGAGKTAISTAISRREPERFIMVPEAASQVYASLNTRWDFLDAAGRRDVQRRIYRLQREQEDRIAAEYPHKILLLDRGTVDGAAYWPEGPESYWQDLGTNAETEFARYAQVVWLQTGAIAGIYDGDKSNPCRFEDADAAVDCGNRLRTVWGKHPNLMFVDVYPTLEEKVQAVRGILTP